MKNNIQNKIQMFINSLREMYSKHLLDIVDPEDKNLIFIKIVLTPGLSDVKIEMYNALTNVIISKTYPMAKLLKECSNIFTVNEMVINDCKVMYQKSKKTIYKTNTIINIL